MLNYQYKLDSLTDSSVWVFTKQSISFDTAFKAVKLLKEMPNRKNGNIKNYFTNNYDRYDIDTNIHRVLVISQLFGLLTKTPLYERGGRYNTEQPTEMFELLNKYSMGSKEYNVLKTEQILKVKIKAIIDTANNNKDWNILPVIFSYKVLKALKEQYNINTVSLELYYTYIMTCSNYSEVNDAVEFIKSNCPATEFVPEYKGRSRFTALVQGNLGLFVITSDSISINENFDKYFNYSFMEVFDIDELNIQLSRDVDYTYFLTTHQNFNVNLIDYPTNQNIQTIQISTIKAKNKKVVSLPDGSYEDEDTDYVNKVNEIKEYNINFEIGKDADKVKPTITTGGIAKRYSKNPIIGKIAIQKTMYLCENIEKHITFISNTTNKQYMEAHHLIPISYQEEMWDRFGVNIDCVENIVSLCPNCHSAIHYAIKEVKIDIIKKAYALKIDDLRKVGITLSLDEVIGFYFGS